MSKLSMEDPRGRFLLSSLARIFDQIDSDARIESLLIGTTSAEGEEIHYYVISGRPDVQRMLMRPNSEAARRARELLASAAVRLDAPATPSQIGDPDTTQ